MSHKNRRHELLFVLHHDGARVALENPSSCVKTTCQTSQPNNNTFNNSRRMDNNMRCGDSSSDDRTTGTCQIHSAKTFSRNMGTSPRWRHYNLSHSSFLVLFYTFLLGIFGGGFWSNNNVAFGFNLDTRQPVKYSGPPGSYFGYSVLLHENAQGKW